MDMFGKVEYALHLALRLYANVDDTVAKAVFSGLHSDQLRGHLKRLANSGKIPKEQWASLSPLMDQLRQITERRNDILHYGVVEVGDIRLSTNVRMAHRLVRSHVISDDILNRMTDDLLKIAMVLAGNHAPAKDKMIIDQNVLYAIAHSPWRYKSSLQRVKSSASTRYKSIASAPALTISGVISPS